MGTKKPLAKQGAKPFVIIESPCGGEHLPRNLVYLRRSLRDSWNRGELPFASHAFFPFFLRESLPEEREAGIEAGYEFWAQAARVAFYIDYGLSPGMAAALTRCRATRLAYQEREIGANP